MKNGRNISERSALRYDISMISKEIIQKIIEAGVQAPSGSNSQPWRFEVSKNVIDVHMVPEKDHPVLNFRERGTILANGALIRNMLIAADHFGLNNTARFFPDASDRNLTVKISLSEGVTPGSDKLFTSITKRATNRKPYEKRQLNENEKATIVRSLTEGAPSSVVLKFTDDVEKIKILAEAASKNETVLFEDKCLHGLFFEEIVWTEREEKERKEGLYLKTMELQPPQAAALRIFKFWPIMRMVNGIGFAKNISRENAAVYARCSLYGAVLCGDNDEDFLKAGMAIEGVWLAATAAGMSFHLQTGINFMWQRLRAGEGGDFSPKHAAIIREAYQNIVGIFGTEKTNIPAIFRIGYDGEPSARSSKKAPEIIFHPDYGKSQ